MTVPADFPVQPLLPDQTATSRATCGHCGRSWDDAIPTSYTPAPSARCPFEAFHEDDDDTSEATEIVISVRGGLVCSVYSTDPRVQVVLVDWDNINQGDENPLGTEEETEAYLADLHQIF